MQRVAVLVILANYVSSMEMRETVERMVMVRTTGSDLQPAATGFIYKKESDRPASIVEMGESEVVQQLSKMYEQPKSFAAPIPVVAGPFHVTDEESKAVALSSESKIIPIEGKVYQKTRVDGLADEDFKNIFKYASNYGKYNTNVNDYLKELGYTNDESVFDGNIRVNHGNGHEEDRDNLNRNKDAKHFSEGNEKHQEYIIYDEPNYTHTINKYYDEFTSGPPSQHLKLYEENATHDSYKNFFNNENDKYNFSYHVPKPNNDFSDNDSDHLVKDHAESQRYHDDFTPYSGKQDESSYGYRIRH